MKESRMAVEPREQERHAKERLEAHGERSSRGEDLAAERALAEVGVEG